MIDISIIQVTKLILIKDLNKLKILTAHCQRHGKHKSTGSEFKPNSFDGLKSLEKLKIQGCDLVGENDLIALTNLKELQLGGFHYKVVPDTLTNLKKLNKL